MTYDDDGTIYYENPAGSLEVTDGWGNVVPLFLPYSVGDVLDAVAYALGTIAYQQAITANTSTAPKDSEKAAAKTTLSLGPDVVSTYYWQAPLQW